MFGMLLRGGTYYLLWNKFREQFIMLLASALLIGIILNIYNDLFTVLKISDKESVLQLLLLKWFLIMGIVGINLYQFQHIKTTDKKSPADTQAASKPKQEKALHPMHEHIKHKETLLSTTDLILEKYSNKRDGDARD